MTSNDAPTDSPKNFEALLDLLEEMSAERDEVSIDNIVEAVGRRSFGPLLLVAGLLTLAPVISGIPGLPTLAAAIILLVSVQLLMARDHFWLPKLMLNRSIASDKFTKALGWMRKPARGIDYLLKNRLVWMLSHKGVRIVAIFCVLIALAMPPMELVPFSANAAGLALALFGLGLMAKDGLLVMVAMLVTLSTLVLVFNQLV
ncbi:MULTISPECIES: exopolysaccharide biosynthesis protein [Halomonadaceae]|uniref:exopolysaccharide biosynthesis protein n=1 Tax=Halomonadaceae TaxID=28256 RepID=UPI001597E522|nr:MULTISPECIES: exopolysaccharide biosynthesis protein [Halomonas]QJQ94221.1 exopolysaccharide biosynthesis protein [Halomonas sp. PA5]